MAWTKEQEMAISTKGCNLLVAAAAGAGKTAVLVERIIKKLTDNVEPIDIDRLLVVTYTNAAASEMRERVGDAISKELEKNPDSSLLRRQMALLGKAHITTVHSFCLDVIRHNFELIDLDPVFRISDSTENVLFKQDVLDELFDEKYEDENLNPEFLRLVECYGGGRDDIGLKDMVLKLYEFSESAPYPEEWLYSSAEKFNVDDSFDFGSSPWAGVIMDELKIEITGLICDLERILPIIDGLSDFEAYQAHIKNEIQDMEILIKSLESPWDDIVSKFASFEFQSLPRTKKGVDEETRKLVSEIRDRVKKKLNDIKNGIMLRDSKKIAEELTTLYPSMKALASLTVEFRERFKARKREKGVLDFSDIEHYAIEILVDKNADGGIIPSAAAMRYRDFFEEVLVDEYQDSNIVQELILSMVSRKDSDEPNLFMVGDVKQSIYRFRQARPELFLEKYNSYQDSGKERRILLYKNFRSRAEVLDASNYIFKALMSKNIGELDYNDSEKLNYGALYPPPKDGLNIKHYGGPVEVNIVETGRADDAESLENTEDLMEEAQGDLDSVELEARAVALRIRKLMNEDGYTVSQKVRNEDGSEDTIYRPVEYRDIVILMRSISSTASVFTKVLEDLGIPVYSDAGNGYFEVAEVQTIVSLLEIADNPMQDIPLIAVLRSPIASFTPEDLIDIRVMDNKRSFYEAMKLKAGSGDGEVSKKAGEFLRRLFEWRKKSKVMSISEFIWYLYTDTGYYAYAGAMPGGTQRQANLRILFERARQYEKTSFKGLFNFVNFIKKLKESSGDMAEARTLGENENVVRIMSIHKSKGLEFPVVFVSGLGRGFNLKDLERRVLFHHSLGFGPDLVDCERRFSYSTAVKHAIKGKLRLENYSEEMRVLYVAMTRAREKLILTGTVGSLEKAFKRWGDCVYFPGNKVPEYHVQRGKNFLDWICPALLKHESLRDFRELAGINISLGEMIDDLSLWEINISRLSELLKVQDSIMDYAAAGVDSDIEGKYRAEVERRLFYSYPYSKSSMIHTKLTVTELKKMLGTSLDDEYTEHIFVPEIIKKPVFLEGREGISAAEKGTLMHLVMQHVPMGNVPTIESVRSLLDVMSMDEFMTVEQKSFVDIKRIVRFFESPLGQRILKSKNVKREVPFYMEVKACEIYKGLEEDRYVNEMVILQGVIDCYFEEQDGLVLIDYKTDFVKDGNTDTIREKYAVQIDYYSKTLEKLTGKRVKEKYIYLFYNNEIIEF